MLADIAVFVTEMQFQLNVFVGGDVQMFDGERFARAAGNDGVGRSILGNGAFDAFALFIH